MLQSSDFDLVILDTLLPQGDTLPGELFECRREAGLEESSERLGLVLGLWLVERRRTIKFFFYTIIPDDADTSLRMKLDPDGTRFVDKADESTWGEMFPVIVFQRLS
jgi:hypothetical protein